MLIAGKRRSDAWAELIDTDYFTIKSNGSSAEQRFKIGCWSPQQRYLKSILPTHKVKIVGRRRAARGGYTRADGGCNAGCTILAMVAQNGGVPRYYPKTQAALRQLTQNASSWFC